MAARSARHCLGISTSLPAAASVRFIDHRRTSVPELDRSSQLGLRPTRRQQGTSSEAGLVGSQQAGVQRAAAAAARLFDAPPRLSSQAQRARNGVSQPPSQVLRSTAHQQRPGSIRASSWRYVAWLGYLPCDAPHLPASPSTAVLKHPSRPAHLQHLPEMLQAELLCCLLYMLCAPSWRHSKRQQLVSSVYFGQTGGLPHVRWNGPTSCQLLHLQSFSHGAHAAMAGELRWHVPLGCSRHRWRQQRVLRRRTEVRRGRPAAWG